MFQGHCLSGISDLVTVEFRKNNERFGIPTLTDERALTLVREVTDTDRRATVGNTTVMYELKRTTVQYIFSIFPDIRNVFGVGEKNT